MNNNLLNQLPKGVLNRLAAQATKEHNAFLKDLESERNKLNNLRNMQDFIVYGDTSTRNIETIINVKGTPCIAVTGMQSEVLSIKELNQEAYNQLEMSDKQAVKQYDKALYFRLENNDYQKESKSDAYYSIVSEAEGKKISYVEQLGRDIEKEFGNEAWSKFTSPELRTQGIYHKEAEEIAQMHTDENRLKLANEVFALEDKISYMEANSDYPVEAVQGE
ncbi:hypothetical protein IKS_03673 [Bacillus cereus VDM062]|nr:hypothetical protein IKS_03673 [Bacillus cereus VDM062]